MSPFEAPKYLSNCRFVEYIWQKGKVVRHCNAPIMRNVGKSIIAHNDNGHLREYGIMFEVPQGFCELDPYPDEQVCDIAQTVLGNKAP